MEPTPPARENTTSFGFCPNSSTSSGTPWPGRASTNPGALGCVVVVNDWSSRPNQTGADSVVLPPGWYGGFWKNRSVVGSSSNRPATTDQVPWMFVVWTLVAEVDDARQVTQSLG